MQRAAASAAPSTSPSDSQHKDTPPPKRQKLSNEAPSATATPSDLELIHSALDEEQLEREKVIERLAEEAGETKWVLSTVDENTGEVWRSLRVAITGYSDIDQDKSDSATQGRQSFGKFNRELEVGSVEVLYLQATEQYLLQVAIFDKRLLL